MKNKKMLYVLVPAVILIWGAVVFSIFSHIHNPDTSFEHYSSPAYSKVSESDSSKYQLIANYRDPFNAGMKNSSEDEISEQEKLNKIQKMNQQVNWPNIEFLGKISHNKKWVVLLKVNNSNILMQEGDEKLNIKLLKMYNDSVLLNFQKDKRVFVISRRK